MCLLNIDCSSYNSSCLHLGNLWICYCKTASSVSHHWIKLMQTVDNSLDLFYSLALRFCQFLNIFFLCRNEFMKRWIKESDSYRITFKCLIKCFEISLLIWQNLIKCCFSFFYSIRTYHLSECCNSVLFKEHMLSTAKSDTFCTKFSCLLGILRSICISTNL